MSRKYVVLIEDSPNDQLLISRVLSKLNPSPDVLVLNNGNEAVEYFKRPVRLPDLVLVDLNLPKVNGIEVIRQAKQHPKFLLVPFVILTDNNYETNIIEAYKAGASSYILKPDGADPMGWGREIKGAAHYWLNMNRLVLKESVT